MIAERKKSPSEGRSAAPAGEAAAASGGGDPMRDLLDGLPQRGQGQRGPGRRSQDFVNKLAATYGMLPGDLLAATLMRGLPKHLSAGGDPGDFLEARAIQLANSMQTTTAQAMGLLMGVARELMPYAHQRLPQLIDVESKAVVFAMISPSGQAVPGGGGVIDMRPADVRGASIVDETQGRSDGAGRTEGQ
jgi:hypothetical protein